MKSRWVPTLPYHLHLAPTPTALIEFAFKAVGNALRFAIGSFALGPAIRRCCNRLPNPSADSADSHRELIWSFNRWQPQCNLHHSTIIGCSSNLSPQLFISFVNDAACRSRPEFVNLRLKRWFARTRLSTL